MKAEKKIDKTIKLINRNIDLFRCPICGKEFSEAKEKALVCENNHCFDISKKGYINLLNSTINMEYSKELFEARNYVCSTGFYSKLQEKITEIIKNHIAAFKDNEIRIMDVGCGEGSHLRYIINELNKVYIDRITGIGIDISKNAIVASAKEFSDILWSVADLAKQPFAEKSISMILNILSPANYKEFSRLLKEDGVLIKIIPGKGYLKELREGFYSKTDKAEYSNQKIMEHLEENMKKVYEENLKYTVELTKHDLEQLTIMTPLSWSADKDQIRKFIEKSNRVVTVDLHILVCGSNK